jgi:hypothetical protein
VAHLSKGIIGNIDHKKICGLLEGLQLFVRVLPLGHGNTRLIDAPSRCFTVPL